MNEYDEVENGRRGKKKIVKNNVVLIERKIIKNKEK